MYCSNCGKKCEESDTFCKNCGAHIYANHDFTDAMPDNVQDQADRFKQDDRYDMGDNQQNGNQVNNGGEYVPTEKDKKNKRNAIILTVVISALVIVVPIVVCIIVFANVFTSIKTEFLEIGDSRVYNVLDFAKEAKVCGFRINQDVQDTTNISINICNMNEVKSDIEGYLDYMVDNYNYKEVGVNKIEFKGGDGLVIKIWIDENGSNIVYKSYYEVTDNNLENEGTGSGTINDVDVPDNIL